MAAGKYMWVWGHGQYSIMCDLLPQLEKKKKKTVNGCICQMETELLDLFTAQVGCSAFFHPLLQ